ncbi:MAG TPA: hypothetical protein VLH79_12560 [Chthonomonadales bacterium]|nr:hypothetical protein [Chthonomonadales bacterium]
MRRTSIVVLVACAVVTVSLVAHYVPIVRASTPDFAEADGRQLLDRLAAALTAERVDQSLRLAFDDATVAGKQVDELRDYLRRGFAHTRNLRVRFNNITFARPSADLATINADAEAVEVAGDGRTTTEVYYRQRVSVSVRRRSTPQLGGLFDTYTWKIADVSGPRLPEGVYWPMR